MKAVVVGRHQGNIPGIEVLEQVSPQYPADSNGTMRILSKMFEDILFKHFRLLDEDGGIIEDTESVVIFQAAPAQLVVALNKLISSGNCRIDRIGFIVSVPGDRPAGSRFNIAGPLENIRDGFLGQLIKHCNPTAKFEQVGELSTDVVVDKPMVFNFSHIEWLS